MESLSPLAAPGAARTEAQVPAADAARAGGPVRRAGAAVLACYLAAALVMTWRLWTDPASHIVAGNPSDADLFAWYLRYAADAVRHGHLPALVTSALNAPRGVNLMWNTSLLLPGVLLAPVTLLFGPQVSLTILSTAGFAGSAASLYLVLRRWQVSVSAAALAGAVYGFSPALLHSAFGHYNLQLAVLPPLIIDAGLRLAVGRRGNPLRPAGGWARSAAAGRPARPADGDPGAARLPGDRHDRQPADRLLARWLARVPAFLPGGIWLGLLVAAQIFISEEIALITALTGVLLAAGLAAASPAAAARRAGPALAGLAVAVAVAFALAGPALRVQFGGRLVQHGALFPPDWYVNDLTSFVNPSGYLLFHTAGTAARAASYQGGLTEYLAYLGWPLIIAVVAAAAACWRRPAGRALALTLAFLVVFSLGGHPLVGGATDQAVDLPWHWLEEHPLFATVLPDRLSIVADGVAATLLALGMDATAARLATARARWVPGARGAAVQAPARPGRVPGARGAAVQAAARPGRVPGARGPAVQAAARPGRARRHPMAARDRAQARWALRHPAATVTAVAVLACLPLLPRPLPQATVLPLPAGWSAAWRALRLGQGARVLVVPVPTNILTAAMRWQAETGQPREMVGGYFIGPGAGGQAYLGGTGVSPVAWYLDRLWAAGLAPRDPLAGVAWAAGLPPALAAVRDAFAYWRPAAVVAVAAPGSPLGRYLTGLLGPPTVTSGRVLAWKRAT